LQVLGIKCLETPALLNTEKCVKTTLLHRDLFSATYIFFIRSL